MRKGKLITDWKDGGMKEGEIVTITSTPDQDEWLEFMGCALYHAKSRTGYSRLPQSFVKLEPSPFSKIVKKILKT